MTRTEKAELDALLLKAYDQRIAFELTLAQIEDLFPGKPMDGLEDWVSFGITAAGLARKLNQL